jgi:hypothetical protein
MGGSAFDDIDHRVAALGAGGDIEEDHFIGALFVVADGEFDGVADDAEAPFFGAAELDAASDFTVVDIEAGNDAFREHRKRGWIKRGWKLWSEKRAREIWVAEWLEGRWRMGKTFGGDGLGDEGGGRELSLKAKKGWAIYFSKYLYENHCSDRRSWVHPS